jgi:hypothetical protein
MRITIPDSLVLPETIVRQSLEEISKRDADVDGIVWFMGNRAVKTKLGLLSTNYADLVRAKLVKEAIIGRDLEAQGIRMPSVEGVYIPENDLDIPFLVMRKVDLKPIRFFSEDERKSIFEQYDQEIERVRRMGYIPRDRNWDRNCGVDCEGRVVLFDFEEWRMPPHVDHQFRQCYG